MPVTSNFPRAKCALLQSDLSKKPATSRRRHPNSVAADLGRAQRNSVFLGFSADRIASPESAACSIAVSGKSRLDSCCGASWTAAEYRNRLNSPWRYDVEND